MPRPPPGAVLITRFGGIRKPPKVLRMPVGQPLGTPQVPASPAASARWVPRPARRSEPARLAAGALRARAQRRFANRTDGA